MANLKASKIDIRKTASRTERNRVISSRLKTLAKKVDAAKESGDAAAQKEAATLYMSALDRAAKRNVIHTNKANRHKSALTAMINA